MSNISLHRYALAVSVWMMILVAIGSVVTTEGVGRAIPDWPLAFGQLLPAGPRAPGVLLVLWHRFAALAALFLVTGLVLFVRGQSRPVRSFAWCALALVLAQVILGGAVVLLGNSDWLRLAHAGLAHLALFPAAAVAAVTHSGWSAQYQQVNDYGWPSLRSLAILTPALVFLQILLGASFRHHVLGLIPHIVGAILVAVLVLLFGLFVLTQCPRHDGLKNLATAVLLVLFVQVVLGVLTYMIGASAAGEEATPGIGTALVTAGHVVTGGVLFIFCTLLGIQVRRFVLPKLAPVNEIQAAS